LDLVTVQGKLNVDIKVLSMLQSGEPDNYSPLAFPEVLFYFPVGSLYVLSLKVP